MRICFKGRNITALIAVSAAALLLVPAAFSTGLEGYWTLNEGRGTTAADSSGNGNTGNVIGARWVSGKFKSALQFDGIDDAMQVPSTLPNFSTLEPQTVTVEAWVKRSGSPGVYKHIVAKGADGCNAASYALYTGATGGLAFYIYEGIQFSVSPNLGPGVWDGNWHHVAGTFDGFTVRLYVDGVEVGGGTPSFLGIGYGLTTTNDLYAGMYAGCGAHNFDGAVDEPRIWSRALASVEIAASAAMGFDAVNEIKRESVSSESIVFTSHFKSSATGGPIVISLESASGLRTISNVQLETTKKGTFSCGGTSCPIALSNGGRTASLAVTGTSGASGKLRVTLDNSSTFAANVALG